MFDKENKKLDLRRRVVGASQKLFLLMEFVDFHCTPKKVEIYESFAAIRKELRSRGAQLNGQINAASFFSLSTVSEQIAEYENLCKNLEGHLKEFLRLMKLTKKMTKPGFRKNGSFMFDYWYRKIVIEPMVKDIHREVENFINNFAKLLSGGKTHFLTININRLEQDYGFRLQEFESAFDSKGKSYWINADYEKSEELKRRVEQVKVQLKDEYQKKIEKLQGAHQEEKEELRKRMEESFEQRWEKEVKDRLTKAVKKMLPGIREDMENELIQNPTPTLEEWVEQKAKEITKEAINNEKKKYKEKAAQIEEEKQEELNQRVEEIQVKYQGLITKMEEHQSEVEQVFQKKIEQLEKELQETVSRYEKTFKETVEKKAEDRFKDYFTREFPFE